MGLGHLTGAGTPRCISVYNPGHRTGSTRHRRASRPPDKVEPNWFRPGRNESDISVPSNSIPDVYDIDVLVVGAGPGGSAAGYWLARSGVSVLMVERKVFPRDKTCGDGLTPRAVKQLTDMGMLSRLEAFHRHDGLRAIAANVTLDLAWPEHPVFPPYGYVVRRHDLDEMVAVNAVEAGAELWQGAEAVAPKFTQGILTSVVIKTKAGFVRNLPGESGLHNHVPMEDRAGEAPEPGRSPERFAAPAPGTIEVRPKFVVIADGSLSRFGRAIGARRDRDFPQGMAIRTYYQSDLSTDPVIESTLDVRDRQGNAMPGYGWVFPLGDGTINVGVGLLSTFKNWKQVNTTHMMQEFAATAPPHWGINPDAPLQPATGGRLPMAGSVFPKVGPNYLLIGDAAGSVNPFNGEGIDYAYETAREAASLIAVAVSENNALALTNYERWLDAEYGLYFQVASLFATLIGQPALMRQLTQVGMQSRSLMEWALRVMANLLRPDEVHVAELAYQSIAQIVRVALGPSALAAAAQ